MKEIQEKLIGWFRERVEIKDVQVDYLKFIMSEYINKYIEKTSKNGGNKLLNGDEILPQGYASIDIRNGQTFAIFRDQQHAMDYAKRLFGEFGAIKNVDDINLSSEK
jgi:hypothetical protein